MADVRGLLPHEAISLAPAEDAQFEISCERALRLMRELHPNSFLTPPEVSQLNVVINVLRTSVLRENFEGPNFIEHRLIRRFHEMDPVFEDFWKMFRNGYLRMNPDRKREILLRYLDWRAKGDLWTLEFMNQNLGFAQALSIHPPESGYYSSWNLAELALWMNESPEPEVAAPFPIMIDSSVFASKEDGFRARWLDDLRKSIAEGLGIESVGRLYLTPTVSWEQGSGVMPSWRREFGPFGVAPIYERALLPGELSFLERTHILFKDLGIGHSTSQSAYEYRPDMAILAEATLQGGYFFTRDYGFVFPFDRFHFEDGSEFHFDRLSDLGLKLTVRVQESRTFNRRFNGRPTRVYQLEIQDQRSGETSLLRLVHLKTATPSPQSHPGIENINSVDSGT